LRIWTTLPRWDAGGSLAKVRVAALLEAGGSREGCVVVIYRVGVVVRSDGCCLAADDVVEGTPKLVGTCRGRNTIL